MQYAQLTFKVHWIIQKQNNAWHEQDDIDKSQKTFDFVDREVTIPKTYTVSFHHIIGNEKFKRFLISDVGWDLHD